MKVADRPSDRVGFDPGGTRDRHRSKDVLQVVLAKERDVSHRQHRCYRPRVDEHDVVSAPRRAVGDALIEAEVVYAAVSRGRHPSGHRVIETEDSVIEREAHQTPLGLGVCSEISVAVEVIRRDVEHASDRTAWLGHRFDLERRKFENHPVRVADRVQTVEHGRADVAAEVDLLAGALEDRGDERGGRGLAIGAGDAADAGAAAFEDEVHLAAYGHTVGASDLELGSIPPDTGTRTDHERVRGDVLRVAAEPDLDLRREERGALPEGQPVCAIDEHDLVPLPGERHRAGETAAPGSDHHDRLPRHETGPATRAKSTVIAVPTAAAAANAATRRCSRSPSSSK